MHYIIHACDTPSLAPDGLAAARHYGEIAASAPHAVHMPGHIFARLGLWTEDIESNLGSVAASKAAESRHQSGAMDQFHSDDFLLYAFLQTAQDARAKAVIADSAAAVQRFKAMPEMGERYMEGMFPYYSTKLPVFFALEMRDWQAAAALEPVAGARRATPTQWLGPGGGRALVSTSEHADAQQINFVGGHGRGERGLPVRRPVALSRGVAGASVGYAEEQPQTPWALGTRQIPVTEARWTAGPGGVLTRSLLG